MRTAAVLPVKRFTLAKQRLGESVADQTRLALARAMVGDVLAALQRTDAIDLIVLVTREREVRAPAAAIGALLIDEPQQLAGQSGAASLGIAGAIERGAERVLCVPGDCPALDPDELQQLLDGEPPGVVIIPDRHGTGTNGLLLSPPLAIEPSFGPGSCERHAALAQAAGVSWRLARPASLLLDIDTGSDLAELRRRLAGLGARAAGTRAVLETDGEPLPARAAGA